MIKKGTVIIEKEKKDEDGGCYEKKYQHQRWETKGNKEKTLNTKNLKRAKSEYTL